MSAQVISFKCHLRDRFGKLISTTYNRDVLTMESHPLGMPLPGLNKNMQNLKKGEIRKIALAAEEAYGLYDLKKIILFPASQVPKSLRVGEQVQIVSRTGITRNYRFLETQSGFVRLDGNHPLAGQDLIFEVEVLDVRSATALEVEESLNAIGEQFFH